MLSSDNTASVDVFDVVQRHTLHTPEDDIGTTFPTQLADIHEQIIMLLDVPKQDYYEV